MRDVGAAPCGRPHARRTKNNAGRYRIGPYDPRKRAAPLGRPYIPPQRSFLIINCQLLSFLRPITHLRFQLTEESI